MQYKFKRALQIGKIDFKCGNNHVPEECENHPHFLRYVGLGLIVDVELVTTLCLEDPQVRAKIILDRLAAKSCPPCEEKPVECEPEVSCEDDKPKKKNKKSE